MSWDLSSLLRAFLDLSDTLASLQSFHWTAAYKSGGQDLKYCSETSRNICFIPSSLRWEKPPSWTLLKNDLNVFFKLERNMGFIPTHAWLLSHDIQTMVPHWELCQELSRSWFLRVWWIRGEFLPHIYLFHQTDGLRGVLSPIGTWTWTKTFNNLWTNWEQFGAFKQDFC